MKLLAIIAVGAILAGCQPHDYTKDSGFLRTEDRRYQLVGINPPKHFRVELRDAETNQVVDARVSKHCSTWRTNAIKGSYYIIPVRVYRDARGGERREFVDLYKIFCK